MAQYLKKVIILHTFGVQVGKTGEESWEPGHGTYNRTWPIDASQQAPRKHICEKRFCRYQHQ